VIHCTDAPTSASRFASSSSSSSSLVSAPSRLLLPLHLFCGVVSVVRATRNEAEIRQRQKTKPQDAKNNDTKPKHRRERQGYFAESRDLRAPRHVSSRDTAFKEVRTVSNARGREVEYYAKGKDIGASKWGLRIRILEPD
jgi:hypothetical protein